MDYIERIEALGACAPAMAWLRSGQYPSLQVAWDACPRGDWMLWLLLKRADAAYAAARDAVLCSPEVCAAYDAAYDVVWRYASDPEYSALANLGMVKARAVRAAVPVAPVLP